MLADFLPVSPSDLELQERERGLTHAGGEPSAGEGLPRPWLNK